MVALKIVKLLYKVLLALIAAPLLVLFWLNELLMPTWQRGQNKSNSEYPVYGYEFMKNITFKCTNCDNQFWIQNDEDGVYCYYCDTNYTLETDDIPECLRAKCWNCGQISDTVGGSRAENLSFVCDYCEFRWESDPY